MIKVLSLFSGIGGFDLGLERAGGFEIVGQVEIDPFCNKVLAKHWPDVKRMQDIKEVKGDEFGTVELICGGDPCPIRSKARSIWQTKKPDMSGFFLALVDRCKPRWVLRENIPASDDIEFYFSLDLLGYRSVIIAANAAKITAQNRERDIIVGCNNHEFFNRFTSTLPISKNDKRYAETKYQKVPTYLVLTTHPCRYDTRDGYIWDGHGIRIANSKERCKFAGFPVEWLDGISKTQVARMTGNAVVPQIIEILGRAIMEAEGGDAVVG